MYVKGTGSRCVLVEHVKDNYMYYVRFHETSYHRQRENLWFRRQSSEKAEFTVF